MKMEVAVRKCTKTKSNELKEVCKRVGHECYLCRGSTSVSSKKN